MRAAKFFTSLAGRRSRGMMKGSVVLLLAAPFLVALALAGCRDYGHYDAREKMLPEMRQSVERSASTLARARSNFDLLQQAARGDSALRVVAAEYEQAVAQHEQMLESNENLLAAFEDDLPDYRTMHRNFGATISEEQATRNRYRSLVRAVRYPDITTRLEEKSGSARAQRSLPDTLAGARDETYTEARYYVAPIFYERLQSAGSDVTMRQALAERKQRQAQSDRRRTASPRQGEGDRLSLSPGRATADTARRVPQR